jgi:hypothetical protein
MVTEHRGARLPVNEKYGKLKDALGNPIFFYLTASILSCL